MDPENAIEIANDIIRLANIAIYRYNMRKINDEIINDEDIIGIEKIINIVKES